jgi:hypothetical protein
MQIEFEFEMNDWMAFQKHYLVNSKVYKQVKIDSNPIDACDFSCINSYKS